MLILDQYGVPFHAVVLFCPDPDFLKSSSTYCTATQRCGALTLEVATQSSMGAQVNSSHIFSNPFRVFAELEELTLYCIYDYERVSFFLYVYSRKRLVYIQ